jgi:hypothetical protein
MPFIIHPLWYWLVFGSYRSEMPAILAMAGMVRMLMEISTKSIDVATIAMAPAAGTRSSQSSHQPVSN